MKKKQKKKGDKYDYFFYDFIKVTGALTALIWIRPKVYYPHGKPDTKGGFMISANHCSFIDPIVILCTFWWRRVFSLATKDLYSTKLRSFLFNSMRCIQVDKQNFSLDSFHEVTRRLKKGKVICIFPEGQLNLKSDDMLAFKSGAILMAHTANVPIVPVYLVPPKKWYNRRISVVGEPINVREICGFMPTADELNRAAEVVHQKENELKVFYHSIKNKNNANGQNESDVQQEVALK